MDFVNKMTGGGNNQQQSNQQGSSSGEQQQQSSGGGGFLSGIGDKMNSAAGGGRESEKNEDYLDKGKLLPPLWSARVTKHYCRCRLCPGEVHGRWSSGQRGMPPPPHSYERTASNTAQSAVEQAKDEQISDYIRKTYKSSTGSDIPIKDKETRFG
jgi:hypothetical protein